MKFKFAFRRPKLPKLPKLPAFPKLTPEQRARLEPYVARWRALSAQQRRLAVFGGALLAVTMLYALLWSPMQMSWRC